MLTRRAAAHRCCAATGHRPQHGHACAMSLLLSAGADVNRKSRGDGGWTALHLCCEHSASLEVARRLLAGERHKPLGKPASAGLSAACLP